MLSVKKLFSLCGKTKTQSYPTYSYREINRKCQDLTQVSVVPDLRFLLLHHVASLDCASSLLFHFHHLCPPSSAVSSPKTQIEVNLWHTTFQRILKLCSRYLMSLVFIPT